MKDYAELKKAIIAWLNREGFSVIANAIPGFITLAEEQIANQVRARCMLLRAVETVVRPTVPLPCDWLAMLEVRDHTTGHALEFYSRLDPTVESGIHGPLCAYRLVGNEMEVLPHQEAASTEQVEIIYFARPLPLLTDADSTALLRDHPSIYLFGALTNAGIFLEDEGRAKVFDSMFQQAVAAANGWQESSRFTGGRLRMRAPSFG